MEEYDADVCVQVRRPNHMLQLQFCLASVKLSVGEARDVRWLIQESICALETASGESPKRKLISLHPATVRSNSLVIVNYWWSQL